MDVNLQPEFCTFGEQSDGVEQFAPPFGSEEANLFVYNRWVELTQAKHRSRWENIRSFEDDEFGFFDLNKPFFRIRDNGAFMEDAVVELAGSFIIPESFDSLSEGVSNLLQREDVRRHRENDGTIAFVDIFHKSYAGIALATAAAARVDLEIARNQTIFISRQVPLYEIFGKKIVDDGVLRVSNVMQTFPDSVSGKDQAFSPYRAHANLLVMRQYVSLLGQPQQILWLAPSGTEAMYSPKTSILTAGRVSPASAKLLYGFNKLDKAGQPRHGRDRVMTIPVSLDCNPFGTDGLPVARDITFAFGEGEILRTEEAVHNMMKKGVALTNCIKKADTPEVAYEDADAYVDRLSLAVLQ